MYPPSQYSIPYVVHVRTLQWSLQIRDTLGAGLLSFIERLSSGGRFESLLYVFVCSACCAYHLVLAAEGRSAPPCPCSERDSSSDSLYTQNKQQHFLNEHINFLRESSSRIHPLQQIPNLGGKLPYLLPLQQIPNLGGNYRIHSTYSAT